MDLKDYCKIYPHRCDRATERASIFEFDGEMNKKEAEEKAVEMTIKYFLQGGDDEKPAPKSIRITPTRTQELD